MNDFEQKIKEMLKHFPKANSEKNAALMNIESKKLLAFRCSLGDNLIYYQLSEQKNTWRKFKA